MRENVGRRNKCAVKKTHLRGAGSQMNYGAEGPLGDLCFAALNKWIFPAALYQIHGKVYPHPWYTLLSGT